MLTIAISSRSLFHLEEANAIFESKGQDAFDAYMEASEDVPLEPGTAFALIKKLMAMNTTAFPDRPDVVDVVLLSRNSPAAARRILRSVNHHGLRIERAVFTRGGNRFQYAKEMGADLFLCVNEADAKHALDNGMAAAIITPSDRGESISADLQDMTVRIAFDGDSVIFSDESDNVYRRDGLRAFILNERSKAEVPLGDGPFKHFLVRLHDLQVQLRQRPGACPLHISLVTARGIDSHARVFNTLRHWGIDLDEVVFAGGTLKGPLLRAARADFFIDDTRYHVESATLHNIAAGRVPFGTGGIAGPKAA